MDLDTLIYNLENIDVWEVLTPVLEQHLDEMEKLNKEQLSRRCFS